MFSQKIGQYWRTIRHLKPGQITNRVSRKLFKARPVEPKHLPTRNFKQIGFLPQENASILSEHTFLFLNKEVTLDFPRGWQDPDLAILWKYNLHYFDGLKHGNTSSELKRAIVFRWISENPAPTGIGWEPYPLSLRIVNWIKWSWMEGPQHTDFNQSLFQQVSFLEKTLEFHLLGNHLLENAKALVFAGCFFEGKEADRWMSRGLSIIQKQLKEQILEDGAHFELSPMYQGIMLELVLDLLALAQNPNAASELRQKAEELSSFAIIMSHWLRRMTHPDGQIALFNDASFGISHTPQHLISWTRKLTSSYASKGITAEPILTPSGYAKLVRGGACLFVDVAEIGPAYLPGHGHADALSIEFSLFCQRLFVNVGTSEYGLTKRREYERGTSAHSTLTLDNKNSSEMWGGFRVGRRAHVCQIDLTEANETIVLEATHNGYSNLADKPMHTRRITLSEYTISIVDMVTKSNFGSVTRFHLHPDISIEIDPNGSSGYLILPHGQKILWTAEATKIKFETYEYAPEFGVLQAARVLCLSGKENIVSQLNLSWEKRVNV